MTLSQLRARRAGHRGTVTRVIGQLDDALEKKEAPKLRLLRRTLVDKSALLVRYDEDILNLVTDEEKVEEEIGRADIIQEEISLSVIRIDEALEALTRGGTHRHSRSRTGSSGSSISDSSGEESTTPSSTSAPTPVSSVVSTTVATLTSAPITTLTSAPITTLTFAPTVTSTSTPIVLTSRPTPLTSTPRSLTYATSMAPPFPYLPTDSTATTTVASLPLFTLPPLGFSTPSTSLNVEAPAYVPPRSRPISHAPLAMASLMSSPPTCTSDVRIPPVTISRTQVKLPKLSIKKFHGDVTKWVTFWDAFNSSIHTNPSLSKVDKFNYLVSLLESTAAEAIAGLSISSANYDEAISTLKKRFGKEQMIVDKHLDALLSVKAVSSHLDTKALRKLSDVIESHVRGLRALGVSSESYGAVLKSILVNKLPSEIRLIVSREMTEEKRDLDHILKVFEREVEARERVATLDSSSNPRTKPRHPTGVALLTNNSTEGNLSCTYCGQSHSSASCSTVTGVSARKEVLRKAGRCYICLRKNHLSRNCRSNRNCKRCRGKHHISICPDDTANTSTGNRITTTTSTGDQQDTGRPTTTLLTGVNTSVLLQTAQLRVLNSDSDSPVVARAILDGGSQRTYISCRLREKLSLPTVRTELITIKAFGSDEDQYHDTCDTVQFELLTKDDECLTVTALAVPLICSPLTSQPISQAKERYDHLFDLELADEAHSTERLDVDILIGSDLYWELVTGRVIRGDSGPVAIETKAGWVLSGPTNRQEVAVNLTFTSSHVLRVDVTSEPTLDDCLRQFWDLESLGVLPDEPSVYERFVQRVRFNGERYEVSLPWKEHHPPLPDNIELCSKRLSSLLRRLQQDQQLLTEYNAVISDQLKRGIIEVVPQSTPSVSDRIHYLPHHGVVRQDKSTSKLRVVYDASARSSGPSLNDCLYTGPKFGQLIFDILLRFRLQKIALTGDIEKAFLMVSINERDRDSLRFLWVADPRADVSEMITLRFTRVVFGVSSSPFLLNATINHHINTYCESDPCFVNKFLSSIYVDDVVTGATDVESAYTFYLKSKLRLADAGFKLRKFVTNSTELYQRIQENELDAKETNSRIPTHSEEDQSYAKSSLGIKTDEKPGVQKVLGIQWDPSRDEFIFDFGGICSLMETMEPTKRNVVGITARFFDPLGVVSPLTILFKIFCQQLCVDKINWDEPLTEGQLEKWHQLLSILKRAEVIMLPRCLLCDITTPIQSAQLIGFCDASMKAYAAVVYLRLKTEHSIHVRFLSSKTRVAPLKDTSIPRLELLSALLLSRLMNGVHNALEDELPLSASTCFTDSKVTLYWIQGTRYEWKQFVENRVTTIRSLIHPDCWRHCPGRKNPADIPSRGVNAMSVVDSTQWFNGPDWLCHEDGPIDDDIFDAIVLDTCQKEMKSKSVSHTLHVTTEPVSRLSRIIAPERYSSSHRLFRVTSLVLKFICALRTRVTQSVTVFDIDEARVQWIKDVQLDLMEDPRFDQWKHQFKLFKDDLGVWRCGGRMSNSCLTSSEQHPILLYKAHHLTRLLVIEAHKRVMHDGVGETLAELRSIYWLIQGRQFVRKIIYHCVVCRKIEGRPCQGKSPPPLPDYRVQPSRPFQATGVDFAGPLYVKGHGPTTDDSSKVWLCLYTCCSTRAVHLDLVPDMTATTFLRSFRRFTARRGIPSRVISDNAKTFKSASSTIREIIENPETETYFSKLHIEWQFNLEKAPWQGGIFERMIKSAKRCLRKSIGKDCLTFDELHTLVVDVEAVLNSRPLTYIGSEDATEPLTPSHLLVGFRVLTLPDHSSLGETDQTYSPNPETQQDETPPSTVSNCQESQVDNNQGSDAVKERPKRMAAVNARAIIRSINED